MFRCFYQYTGGRVSAIIKEAEQKNSKKATLPSSTKDDKISKFYDDYKNHIDVQGAYESFAEKWELQKQLIGDEEEEKKRMMPRIAVALVSSFSADLWKAVVAKLVWGILLIFSIWFFVFGVLDFIKLKKDGLATRQDQDYAIILCALFFLCMFTLSVAIQQMGHYSSDLGSRVKAALTTAIYKKMITREGHGSEADVVSLVAKDVEKLAEACLSLQYLWSGIFETAVVLVVVTILMGIITILPGIALIMVFLPLQYCLGLTVAYGKKKLSTVSNHRIMLMEEILRGIKLIKIYGWENSFFEKLVKIRHEEGTMRTKISQYQAAILGLVFCLPPLLSLTIFGTAELTGTVQSVLTFTVLSFFNTLRVPFSKLPKSLRDVLDGMSCFERIESFLLEPDLPKVANTDKQAKTNQGIMLNNLSVSYGHGATIVLDKVNLNVPKGSLMMVAGPVASGKSNLLKTLLGELTIVHGTCSTSPSKAYVPQTPWTALGTVRENIVFGNEFDEVHYKKVIHACSLEPDLEMMADGDKTWIGERGGNLSGGQKQRIALARAAYSRADLYVLDSPLSAVDMYTCQHIFKYCIEDIMIAGGGTVVLATHQTELFSKSDHLVVMAAGKLAYNAPYTYQGIKHLFPSFQDQSDGKKEEQVEKKKSKQRVRKADPTLTVVKPVAAAPVKKVNSYNWYFAKMGISLATIGTLIFIIGQIIRVYGDVWISKWTLRRFKDAGYTSDAFYVGLYALLAFAFLALAFIRAFYWLWAGLIAANKIHDESFTAALKAPMHFFHVTPIGELLSFFSKDVDTIDDVLVDNMCLFQIFFWILILALGLVSYNLPMFLVVCAVITIMYVLVVRTFIIASLPLKVENGEAISHVIAHTAETESGLAVVRAFRMEDRFVKENLKFQERSTLSSFAVAQLALWLAYRVDIIGALMVLTCCLLAVLSNGLDPAVAGLIVSNSFQILLFFSIMSRTLGEIHGNMGAIDRAMKMIDLENEQEPEQSMEVKVPSSWPSLGEIKFEDVVMPYLPGKPPVLKGISFSIQEGEKIGVVGRTGAGKSSLIVAMYRLAEISRGSIHVDNVDCASIKLNTLRSSMAIIPQEPVMFQGTVRSNLDPFNQKTDKELMDVLHKCLLGPMLAANPEGLNAKVEFMGRNYSLGTQQLLCLARAMLNPSRVLLLDEATAALDSDTNTAVQHVLKEHFYNRTIFTIAHRLDTIIDSDRILVMDSGVVAEFAPPDVLLKDTESIFHELCMNTGRSQFDVLLARANANAAIREC